MPLQFSPRPISNYPAPSASRILSTDEDAWNLAWLSYDFDRNAVHPDPHFSTHVRRTLQFVIKDASLDFTGDFPLEETVRHLMHNPAPRAVCLILGLKNLQKLPLHQAYGQYWAATILARSRLYREPFDATWDAPVRNLARARAALLKFG